MELASTPKGARAHMLQWDEIDAKIVQWAAYKLRPSRSEVPTEETKGRDYFERRIRDVRRYMQNQGPPTFLKQLQILVEQRRNRPAGYHALLAVFTSEAWREDVRDRSAPKDQALKLAAHVFMHEVLAQDRRDAAAAAANGAAARRELETRRALEQNDAAREFAGIVTFDAPPRSGELRRPGRSEAAAAARPSSGVPPAPGSEECQVCFEETTGTLRCGHPCCAECLEKLFVAQGHRGTRSRERAVRCPMRCHARGD